MKTKEEILLDLLNESGLSERILSNLNNLRIADGKGLISERIFKFSELFADQQSTSDKKLIESLNKDLLIMNDNLLKVVEERNRYKEALEAILSEDDRKHRSHGNYQATLLEIAKNALTPHP